MVAPPVVAFYALGTVWLVVKYRILLAKRSPPLYMIAEVTPAVAVAVTVVIAPNVPFYEHPICAALHIPPLGAAALLAAVLAPLFSHTLFWPGSSVISAMLTSAYAARSECVSTAAIAAGAASIAVLVRLHWYLRGCPEITMYEKVKGIVADRRQAGIPSSTQNDFQ